MPWTTCDHESWSKGTQWPPGAQDKTGHRRQTQGLVGPRPPPPANGEPATRAGQVVLALGYAEPAQSSGQHGEEARPDCDPCAHTVRTKAHPGRPQIVMAGDPRPPGGG